MSESEQLVDIESYVLYRAPDGEKYHRKAACATDPTIPPALDAAGTLFEDLEMYRVSDDAVTLEKLCGNCTQKIQRELRERDE